MPIVLAALAVILVVVAISAGLSRVATRKGYSLGRDTIVRCKQGHLFTTIWIPGGSLKAIRLGFTRFQRCPVSHHWTLVKPVKDADLTDDDRAVAARTHDLRVP